jgi:hypothetical protein
VLDLTHVAQAVLVDPALDRIPPAQAVLAGDARAVRRGDLRWERPLDDDVVEGGRIQLGQPGLGACEYPRLVVAVGVVVADGYSLASSARAVLCTSAASARLRIANVTVSMSPVNGNGAM